MDWDLVLEINKKDVDFSFSKYIETFKNLLQRHAPIKKLYNKDKKAVKKSCITKSEFTENVLKLKMLQKIRNCKTFSTPIEILLIK